MRVLETRAVQRHCCLLGKTRVVVVLARQRRELSKKRYCDSCRRTEQLDQCPLWVLRVTLAVGRPLPLYPDQRTSLVFVGMSQTCQKRAHARELDRLRRR